MVSRLESVKNSLITCTVTNSIMISAQEYFRRFYAVSSIVKCLDDCCCSDCYRRLRCLFVLLAESARLGESTLVLSGGQGSAATGSASVVTDISRHASGGNGSILLGDSFRNLLDNLGVSIADHGNVRLLADCISEVLAVRSCVFVCSR